MTGYILVNEELEQTVLKLQKKSCERDDSSNRLVLGHLHFEDASEITSDCTEVYKHICFGLQRFGIPLSAREVFGPPLAQANALFSAKDTV